MNARREVESVASAVGLRLPENLADDVTQHLAHGLSQQAPHGLDTASHHRRLIVEQATSHHTFFMRDQEEMEAARQLLLRQPALGRPLRIWCAGCSTGEEAYTLAMLAAETGVQVAIHASDISARVLEQAAVARYSALAVRHVPAALLERYFHVEDTLVTVRPALRAHVSFHQEDLLSPHAGGGLEFDLVLCRNVLLYYAEPAAAVLLGVLAARLVPGGTLVLGATDQVCVALPAALERAVDLGRSAYRRRTLSFAAPGPVPKAAPPPAGPPPAAPGNTHHLLEAARLLDAHNFPAALAALDRAEKAAPLGPLIGYCEGVVHRKAQAPLAALASLRAAVFLDEGFWPARFLLARTYARLGQTTRAAQEARHTLSLLHGVAAQPVLPAVLLGTGFDLPLAEVRSGLEELARPPTG